MQLLAVVFLDCSAVFTGNLLLVFELETRLVAEEVLKKERATAGVPNCRSGM
jgi:hypothetical protein